MKNKDYHEISPDTPVDKMDARLRNSIAGILTVPERMKLSGHEPTDEERNSATDIMGLMHSVWDSGSEKAASFRKKNGPWGTMEYIKDRIQAKSGAHHFAYGKAYSEEGQVINYDGIKPYVEVYDMMTDLYENEKYSYFRRNKKAEGLADFVMDSVKGRYRLDTRDMNLVKNILPEGNGNDYGILFETREAGSANMNAHDIQEALEETLGMEDDGKPHVYASNLEGNWMLVGMTGYPQEMREEIGEALLKEMSAQPSYMKINMSDLMMADLIETSNMRDVSFDIVSKIKSAKAPLLTPKEINGYLVEYEKDGELKQRYVRETEDEAKSFCDEMKESDIFPEAGGTWSYRPNFVMPALDESVCVQPQSDAGSFEM